MPSPVQDLLTMPQRRDPGPQAVPYERAKPMPKSWQDRVRELRGKGMPQDMALLTAADEGLIHPKLAEKMLGAMTGADAVTAKTPAELDAETQAAARRRIAADPEMNIPPSNAPVYPPSGPPGSGAPPPMGATYPPSGPPVMAPGPQQRRPGLPPEILAALLRSRGG